MVKNFNIIKALCRSALSEPNDAIIHQVSRLRDSYLKEGYSKEANSLTSLLSASSTDTAMSPSKIQRSFVTKTKEEITAKTAVPVDKETSTPLAEIFFNSELPVEMPLFDENIKNGIKSIIHEWTQYDKLLEIDAKPASSCLIYGVPGTGKTHLAKWISKEIGIPVVLARLEGLMSSFLGTTSRNIGNLFTFANRYNCVLLLDEFDAIAKLRNDPNEVGEVKRVVNTLLQCLDSRKEEGFTIGVTNHQGLLDPAIWRRFDIQMEIPVPSGEVMFTLLQNFLKPLELEESKIKFLVWCIEGASGADARMMSYWIKRAIVLDENEDTSLATIMKRFALLNSGRINSNKRNIMLNSDEEFIAELLADNNYSFKQKDLAPIFGMTASSLSKQISKFKESEKV